ncbi:serine hydrolase domain-containing protein [Halonatronum saccharophilum]|uniref:serine hydrolase domain-containing protein n=1 Tax=Halonatronum saccharophilum TaxID=150060 RepID=UPI00047F38B0|nr:serine hydrolase [Halonatronum saccharophilum]
MKKRYLVLSFLILILVLSSTSTFAMSSSPVEEEWEWKTSTPEEQGMDSEALLGALDYIERQDIDLNSLLVIRNGHIVTEVYYPPHREEDAANLYSATKSVLSSLIGIALEEGYLESVDQRVYDFFPQYYSDDMDPRKKEITIENLLTMTAGYAIEPYWNISEATLPERIIKRPLINQPGESFVYDNGSSDLLAVILNEITDMTVIDFANEYLFEPMEIDYVPQIT